MKEDSKPEEKLHPLSGRQHQTFRGPALAPIELGSTTLAKSVQIPNDSCRPF
ncbi:hypothetical protein RISK_001646 [Rhodopirellula islandica]|uniref:Uncharacterized protein n=1 Tax=Rhodopirellula islandica TaxID=595434 RepID=A0A0J1BIS8_RHOIS|nr:hypothetical protein RISK_001646 [Rhodopirellula islandica]